MVTLLSLLRQCPVVRFRQARSGCGWVLSGVPVSDRVTVGQLVYTVGCRALSSPAVHGASGHYMAFHLSVPESVQQSLWAEFGSLNVGVAGQSLQQ